MAISLRDLTKRLRQSIDDDEGLFQRGKFRPAQVATDRFKQNLNTFKQQPSNFVRGNTPFANTIAQPFDRETSRMRVESNMRKFSPQTSNIARQQMMNRSSAMGAGISGLGLTTARQALERMPELTKKIEGFGSYTPASDKSYISKGSAGILLSDRDKPSVGSAALGTLNTISNYFGRDDSEAEIIKKALGGKKLTPEEQNRLDTISTLEIGGLMGGLKAKGGARAINQRGFSNVADKKPRFEISDRQASLKIKNVQDTAKEVFDTYGTGAFLKRGGPQSTLQKPPVVKQLQEIFDHDGLYRQYPEMKKMRVEFKKLGPDVNAQFNPRTFHLEVNTQLLMDKNRKQLRSSILHELQHGIQEIEGFAKGGSPAQFKNLGADEADDAYRRLAGEVEARDVQAREALSPQQRRARPYGSSITDVNPNDQIVRFGNGTQQSIKIKDPKAGTFSPISPESGRSLGDIMYEPRSDRVKIKNTNYESPDFEPDVITKARTRLQDLENKISETRLTKNSIDDELTPFSGDQMKAIGRIRRIIQNDGFDKARESKDFKRHADDIMSMFNTRSEDDALDIIDSLPQRARGASIEDIQEASNLKKTIRDYEHSKQESLTLERFNKQFNEADENFYRTPDDFKDDAEKIQRAVDSKVGILDYLRTPDRILKKIGLEDEARAIRKGFENYRNDLKLEMDRISSWQKRVPAPESNKRIFQYLDGKKDVQLEGEELKVANEIRDYLSEWADKLQLPDDRRVSNYITRLFERDLIEKEFDPDIARLIRDKVPGSVYDPFTQKRLGKQGYLEDTWRALDAYVKRGTRKYNMDPALNKLQTKADTLDESAFNYVKKLGDRINMRPTELDNLIDNTIKQSPIGYKFGQRPTAVLTNKFRRMVYRSTLGLNVGSAVRNLTQGVNTYSKLGEKYTAIGYTKLMKHAAQRDLDELYRVGVLEDNIVQDRGVRAVKSLMNKVDEGLWVLFDTVEKINRGSAYFGAKSKYLAEGMSEKQAIEQAKKLVRDTQFTFGSVDTPVALSGDVAKTLAQFQSFNIKQAEFLGETIKAKDVKGVARYMAGSIAMVHTIGSLIGMDYDEFIPFFQDRFASPAVQIAQHTVGALTGDDKKKQESINDLKKDAWLAFPAGIQIKKTHEGLGAYDDGAVKFKSGDMVTPVEQNPQNLARAAIFGKWQLPGVREFFDEDQKALSEQQSKAVLQSADPQATYDSIIQRRQSESEEDPSLMDRFRNKVGIVDEAEAADLPQTQELPSNEKDLIKIYTESKKIASNKGNAQENIRLGITSFDDEAERMNKIDSLSQERGDALIRIRQIQQQHPEIIFKADVETYKSGGSMNVEERAEWAANTLGAVEDEAELEEKLNAMYENNVLTKSVVEELNEKYGLNLTEYSSGGKRKSIGGSGKGKTSKITIKSTQSKPLQIGELRKPKIPKISTQIKAPPKIQLQQARRQNMSFEDLFAPYQSSSNQLIRTPKTGKIRIT